MNLKSKKFVALSATLVAAITVGTVIATYSHNDLSDLSKASGTTKEVTLDNEALRRAVLEDYSFPDNRGEGAPVMRPDKKFRLPLPDGGYIAGAVIYHDCGNQYIGTPEQTNATLGDAFYMNSVSGNNAYNFNIAFALDNIDQIHYTYTATLKEGETYPMVAEKYWFYSAMKTKSYTNDGTDQSFYNELESAGYKKILENTKISEGGTYYTKVARSFADDFADNNPNTKSNNTEWLSGAYAANMAVLQFNQSSKGEIDAGKIISFVIKSIKFTYHCN